MAWDARAVANVLVLVLACVLPWYVVKFIRRHRRGIVAERGMSIGADLGALGDQPRVRVRSVLSSGSDQVRLVLEPELVTSPDLDLLVFLTEDEFGYELLHEWQRSESLIAIVQPPGTRIVRLRSTDDLQPLTLRRVEPG
jgi:hypothetical protein